MSFELGGLGVPGSVLGSTTPRLWTPPLRDLTPVTSFGFDVVEFARDSLGRPLDPWQEWLVLHAGELLPDGRPRFRIILVLVARQNGKALSCDTPILTSSGWSTMAGLHIGDEVYHPAGHPVRVTEVHPVLLGNDCYRVTTTDGRSVVADAQHLWTVTDKRRAIARGSRKSRRTVTFETRTLTTQDMATEGLSRYPGGGHTSVTDGKMYTTNEYRFVLPSQEPVKSLDIDLPIDPYLFGAWLGDGDTAGSSLTCGEGESEYWSAAIVAAGYLPTVHGGSRSGVAHLGITCVRGPGRRSRSFGGRLRSLGVLGRKAIPEVYLTAGTGQREALLQGLLDTDGTIEARRGQVEFCSTNRALADGVLFLARSLGWRATLKEGRATLSGRDCGPKYRVCWTPTRQDPFSPFRMPRKAARVKAVDGGKGRTTLSVARIEPVPSTPVRCIRVDSPDGLFLAGRDLIPTHNTELLVILSLFWQFVDAVPLILGTSTKLDYARESWLKAVRLAEKSPSLAELRPPPRWKREANGEQESWTSEGARYKIAASNEEGGRSLTVHRLILDELRQHHDYSAWDASEPATSAVPDAQIWALSNAGSDRSVVLNDLRAAALRFIMTGEGDPRLGLFEWSCPADADPTDIHALAMANPNLGRRLDPDPLLAAARRAVEKGGDALTGFKTEKMCIRVRLMDPAVDAAAWKDCAMPGTLDDFRDRIVACVDVAPDGQHVTLTAAAKVDADRVRVEPVAAWSSTDAARRELGDVLARVKPKILAWYPSGPAAALSPLLRPPKTVDENGKTVKTVSPWGGEYVELVGSAVSEVCMSFADLVKARRVLHSDDPLQNDHVGGAQKYNVGDGWRFVRRGAGHVDAAYTGAGAVHVALTMPIETKKPRSKIY